MQIQARVDQGHAVVTLDGRFDFNSHYELRKTTDALLDDAAIRELTVDLTRVDYMDSSALGMLLLLRERCQARGKSVSLAGARGNVKLVLEVANFHTLFPMHA